MPSVCFARCKTKTVSYKHWQLRTEHNSHWCTSSDHTVLFVLWSTEISAYDYDHLQRHCFVYRQQPSTDASETQRRSRESEWSCRWRWAPRGGLEDEQVVRPAKTDTSEPTYWQLTPGTKQQCKTVTCPRPLTSCTLGNACIYVKKPKNSISIEFWTDSWLVMREIRLIRSPVLQTVDLMFCACFFFIFSFPNSLFPTSASRYFLNFSTWCDFTRKRNPAMPISQKCPLTKMRGEKPQISPNLASNRNILCAVTRNVEGK